MPLLTNLRVQGFQSLHDIDLPLAPLTVIVGPSSSGKSALVRALRTLTANARGTAYVTHGHKRAKITATLANGTNVALTRSPSTKAEDNAYRLDSATHDDVVFTKLAGEVPPEVLEALALPNDPDLTFAAQFDKPYLLAESPQEVARTLAALTNVHVILQASRNANAARLGSIAHGRILTEEATRIVQRHDEFRLLVAKRASLANADDHLERAQSLATRTDALRTLISAYANAEESCEFYSPMATTLLPDLAHAAHLHNRRATLRTTINTLTTATSALETSRTSATTPIPALGPVEAHHDRLSAYRTTLVRLRTARSDLHTHSSLIRAATDALTSAQDDYLHALQAHGTCPTCGQDTAHLAHETVEKIHDASA